MFKKIGLSLVAVIATYCAAMAITGEQIGYPIANGPSYCGSFGNNAVCNNTIPAGPAITGNETIKANTNLPSGQNPQTVLLSMASMGALPYQYVGSPPTATTTTVLANTGTLIIDPTTTLTNYGIIIPGATASTLTDGQILRITSSQTLSAITFTVAAGSTLAGSASNKPTALTVSATAPMGYEFIYNLALTEWFRVQ